MVEGVGLSPMLLVMCLTLPFAAIMCHCVTHSRNRIVLAACVVACLALGVLGGHWQALTEITDVDVMLSKPAVYLYPQQETVVHVGVDLDGELGVTLPACDGEWVVRARPDGTLEDVTSGRGEYPYLFWDGTCDVEWSFGEGFCVADDDLVAFLDDALSRLGLSEREVRDFEAYWVPVLAHDGHPMSVLSFQGKHYEDVARLSVDPAPDSVIRVFMAAYGCDEWVDVPEQSLGERPSRDGFVVVEWGGSYVDGLGACGLR